MKHLFFHRLYVFLLVLLAKSVLFSQEYCVSGSKTATRSLISKVNITDDNNILILSYTSDSCRGYSYIDKPFFLRKGTNNNLYFEGKYCIFGSLLIRRCLKIYIDWNQNTIFEPNEIILEDCNDNNYLKQSAINILVPDSAILGTTIMRIIFKESISDSVKPCGYYDEPGETEDYLITILSEECPALQKPILKKRDVLCNDSTIVYIKNNTPKLKYQWYLSDTIHSKPIATHQDSIPIFLDSNMNIFAKPENIDSNKRCEYSFSPLNILKNIDTNTIVTKTTNTFCNGIKTGSMSITNTSQINIFSYEDSYVFENQKYTLGSFNTMKVGGPYRGFINFNLEQLPNDITIDSVAFFISVKNGSHEIIDVYATDTTWQEHSLIFSNVPQKRQYLGQLFFDASNNVYKIKSHALKQYIIQNIPYNISLSLESDGNIVTFFSSENIHKLKPHFSIFFKKKYDISVYHTQTQELISSSTNSHSLDIDSLGYGKYEIQLQRKNCQKSIYRNIQSENDIRVSIYKEGVSCYNAQDGHLSLYGITTNGSYDVLWTNKSFRSTKKNLTNIFAGIYDLQIIDSMQCTYNTSVTVNSPSPLFIKTTLLDLNCTRDTSTGTLIVQTFGGNNPYSFNWSGQDDIIANNNSVQNIRYGRINLTITDNKNCSLDTSFLIEKPSPIQVYASIKHPYCDDVDGKISIDSILPMNGHYTLQWRHDSSNNYNLSNLIEGSYSLNIRNNKGCTLDTTFFLFTSPDIRSELDIEHVKCMGENTGKIETIVHEGSPPFKYLWNTYETSPIIDSIPKGTYEVIISDKYGCSALHSIDIVELEYINASFSWKNLLNHNGEVSEAYPYILIKNTSNSSSIYTTTWSILAEDGEKEKELHNIDEIEIQIGEKSSVKILKLFVSTANGCTDEISDTIQIKQSNNFFVPNSFSPNGDNINDVFRPVILNVEENSYRMVIYNRYGKKLFESRTLNTGWDGNNSPSGIYSYEIYFYHKKAHDINNFKPEWKVLKGQLFLLK